MIILENKHFCLKQYVNGHEISVSIDDNAGAVSLPFRAEVVVFKTRLMSSLKEIGNSRSVVKMANDILKAEEYCLAQKEKGTYENTPSEIRI